jgi:hypothetical protein
MEVDKTVVILVVILVAVLGFFAFSQMGSADVGGAVSSGAQTFSQYGGGGCGR